MGNSSGIIISKIPMLIAVVGIAALVLITDSQIQKPAKVRSDALPKPAATTMATPTIKEQPMPQPVPEPQTNSNASTSSSIVSNSSRNSVSINQSSNQTSMAGSSSITLNSVSVNGSTVSLEATANPGATCMVETSGPGAPGNFNRTADAAGHIGINWTNASGSWNIKVSCGSASASTSVTVP